MSCYEDQAGKWADSGIFFQWNLYLVGDSNLSNKFSEPGLELLLALKLWILFSFPPRFRSLPWFGISMFLWERKTLSFGGLLATVLTHCLTVLRGTDLHLYSICSAKPSFCFLVRRALLCELSVTAKLFCLILTLKSKHVEESDDTNILILWGFDQWQSNTQPLEKK